MQSFLRPAADLLRKVASNRIALFGAGIIAALVLLALAAPLAQKFGWIRDPLAQFQNGLDSDDMPLTPGAVFKLGTDNLSRVVLSRVLFDPRVLLSVSLAS